MEKKLFSRDFSMVVIGQIISLFGNNILRYAMPLYLLNQTHSAVLYGVVMSLSFLPALLLAPVGGIIADRVNKRSIMVCLDFSTSILVLGYALIYQKAPLVPLLIAVLMLLYGIQGAYQPAVQASVPVLVAPEKLMSGNAVINMVGSLAGIVGPVLGGLIFGFYGLRPILIISIGCFALSAVMEMFIRIPYTKRRFDGGPLELALSDMRESWHFVKRVRPEILRVGLLLAAINFVFSALVIIGLPLVINNYLGFTQSVGNQMYGYAEGALAAGGLTGGVLSGIVGKKINIRHSAVFVLLCALTLLPIGYVLMTHTEGVKAFILVASSSFIMMVLSTILSIVLITYVQKLTPDTFIGKVMALLTCLVMCGSPVGQFIYGVLFQCLAANVCWVYFGAFAVCLCLCGAANKIFLGLDGTVTCGQMSD